MGGGIGLHLAAAGAAIASIINRIENRSRIIDFVNNTIKVPGIFLDLFQFFGGE
jgi:hypothetical protein